MIHGAVHPGSLASPSLSRRRCLQPARCSPGHHGLQGGPLRFRGVNASVRRHASAGVHGRALLAVAAAADGADEPTQEAAPARVGRAASIVSRMLEDLRRLPALGDEAAATEQMRGAVASFSRQNSGALLEEATVSFFQRGGVQAVAAALLAYPSARGLQEVGLIFLEATLDCALEKKSLKWTSAADSRVVFAALVAALGAFPADERISIAALGSLYRAANALLPAEDRDIELPDDWVKLENDDARSIIRATSATLRAFPGRAAVQFYGLAILTIAKSTAGQEFARQQLLDGAATEFAQLAVASLQAFPNDAAIQEAGARLLESAVVGPLDSNLNWRAALFDPAYAHPVAAVPGSVEALSAALKSSNPTTIESAARALELCLRAECMLATDAYAAAAASAAASGDGAPVATTAAAPDRAAAQPASSGVCLRALRGGVAQAALAVTRYQKDSAQAQFLENLTLATSVNTCQSLRDQFSDGMLVALLARDPGCTQADLEAILAIRMADAGLEPPLIGAAFLFAANPPGAPPLTVGRQEDILQALAGAMVARRHLAYAAQVGLKMTSVQITIAAPVSKALALWSLSQPPPPSAVADSLMLPPAGGVRDALSLLGPHPADSDFLSKLFASDAVSAADDLSVVADWLRARGPSACLTAALAALAARRLDASLLLARLAAGLEGDGVATTAAATPDDAAQHGQPRAEAVGEKQLGDLFSKLVSEAAADGQLPVSDAALEAARAAGVSVTTTAALANLRAAAASPERRTESLLAAYAGLKAATPGGLPAGPHLDLLAGRVVRDGAWGAAEGLLFGDAGMRPALAEALCEEAGSPAAASPAAQFLSHFGERSEEAAHAAACLLALAPSGVVGAAAASASLRAACSERVRWAVKKGWSAAADEAAAASASFTDALPRILGLRRACDTLGKAEAAAAAPLLQLAVLDAAVSTGWPRLALCAHAALKQAAPAVLLDGLFALLRREGLFEEGTAAADKPGSGKQLTGSAAGDAIVCFEATGAHSDAVRLLSASLIAARGAGSDAPAPGGPSGSSSSAAEAVAAAFTASGLGGSAAVSAVRSVAALRAEASSVPEAVSSLLSSLLHSAPLQPEEPQEMALTLVQACAASGDARGAVAALLTRACAAEAAAAAAGGAASGSPPPWEGALQGLAELLSARSSEARGSGLEQAADLFDEAGLAALELADRCTGAFSAAALLPPLQELSTLAARAVDAAYGRSSSGATNGATTTTSSADGQLGSGDGSSAAVDGAQPVAAVGSKRATLLALSLSDLEGLFGSVGAGGGGGGRADKVQLPKRSKGATDDEYKQRVVDSILKRQRGAA